MFYQLNWRGALLYTMRLYIKETKQTLSVPQITILFISSQYKTLELLPEIWTSLHEANILMHLITFQLHEWSMHKSPDPIRYAMESGCARLVNTLRGMLTSS